VPSRTKDSKLIGSLILNFLLDHILEIREEMKYPVTMMLDEFTNFGKIMGIGDTLSIIRKNKIGLTLGFQNYFQLEQVYSRKEAQIIMDQPATQVYFKQKNFREAKELSEALGRTTVEEAAVTDAGRVHELVQGRQLITPDELIGLDKEVIVFTADTRPLKLPLTEPTSYDQAMAYDPPSRLKHEVTEFVRRRGRTDAAHDSEEGLFDVEKGKQARQGPPPNAKPQSAEKTKSKPANQEKMTKATPADKQMDEPSMPFVEDVATPPPADDDTQGPVIEEDDISPDFGT
jgi:type IV secretory pathway TraG/TraD family ATPase VirD4